MSYCGCYKPDCMICCPPPREDSKALAGQMEGVRYTTSSARKPAGVSARQWKRAMKAVRRSRQERVVRIPANTPQHLMSRVLGEAIAKELNLQ